MENLIEPKKLTCSHCKNLIESSEAIFCNHCGFPENGTKEQKGKFYGQLAIKKNRNIDAKDKIKSARNTLFILAGIVAIFGLLAYSTHQDILILGINFLLSLIYLTLAFWSEKKPMMALLIGLLLYITTIAITAIFEPTTLIKGVIWKILIVGYLGKGIYSASSIKD